MVGGACAMRSFGVYDCAIWLTLMSDRVATPFLCHRDRRLGRVTQEVVAVELGPCRRFTRQRRQPSQSSLGNAVLDRDDRVAFGEIARE